MANHKSAIKRARQNEVRRARNRAVKTRVKSAAKAVQSAVSANESEESRALYQTAQSIMDKAAKKGVIHKRTAARKKSRLARLANRADQS